MDADSLKKIRLALNLTQAELAERLGVTRTTLSRWEMPNGRYPISEPARKLLLTFLR